MCGAAPGNPSNAFTAIQTYNYDSLNRIKDAKEMIGTTQEWKQTFDYDRYGNRRFDTETDVNGAKTTTLAPGCATAVCNPQIDPATNKLIGYTFDAAGNTKIDAENRQFIDGSVGIELAVIAIGHQSWPSPVDAPSANSVTCNR